MDVGGRIALEKINELTESWKDSITGLKSSDRSNRKGWTGHNTSPVGFKSGCNSSNMNKQTDVYVIDSDDEDVKKKNDDAVLISSDEENSCKDAVKAGSSEVLIEPVKLSRVNEAMENNILADKMVKSTVDDNESFSKGLAISVIRLDTTQKTNSDQLDKNPNSLTQGSLFLRHLLDQGKNEPKQMSKVHTSTIVITKKIDSSTSDPNLRVNNPPTSTTFSKLKQFGQLAIHNTAQGKLSVNKGKTNLTSLSAAKINKDNIIISSCNISSTLPEKPLIRVKNNLGNMESLNGNSEIGKNASGINFLNNTSSEVSIKPIIIPQYQPVNKPMPGMSRSQVYNFQNDTPVLPPHRINMGSIHESSLYSSSSLVQPVIQNSVAINVQNSLPPLTSQEPIAIKLCIPNTGSSLIRSPISVSTTTSRSQPPRYVDSPRLVILQPSLTQPFENLSHNSFNNSHTSQATLQLKNSNFNPQIVIVPSSNSGSEKNTLQNDTMISSKGVQKEHPTFQSVKQITTNYSESSERPAVNSKFLSHDSCKQGAQKTMLDFLEKSTIVSNQIVKPSISENSLSFMKFQLQGSAGLLNSTTPTAQSCVPQPSKEKQIKTPSKPRRNQNKKVLKISESSKIKKVSQSRQKNNQLKLASENKRSLQISGPKLHVKTSENLISQNTSQDTYPQSGQFEIKSGGPKDAPSQISWKVVGNEDNCKEKRNTPCIDIVVLTDSSDEDQVHYDSLKPCSTTVARTDPSEPPFAVHSQNLSNITDCSLETGGGIRVGIDSSFHYSGDHSSLAVEVNFERIKNEAENNLSSLEIIKEECQSQVTEPSLSHDLFKLEKHSEKTAYGNNKGMLDCREVIDLPAPIKEECKVEYIDEMHTVKIEEASDEEKTCDALISNANNVIKTKEESGREDDSNSCDEDFKNKDVKQEIIGDKPFECPHCGFSVAMERNLEMHIKSFHSGNKSKLVPAIKKKQQQSGVSRAVVFETKVFKCSECNFCTHRSSNLTIHLMLEHNLHSCSKCSFVVDNPEDLKHHEATHKKVRCTLCNVTFFAKEYYSHLQSEHEVIYPHKCDYCEFRATAEWKLRGHLLSEHKENKIGSSEYQCDKCDFKTKDEIGWAKHKTCLAKTSHTERCRFVCFCGFRAVSETSLGNHQKLKHPVEKKLLQCNYCIFIALSKHDLKQHKYTFHPERFPHSCDRCSFRTCKLSCLADHLRLCYIKNTILNEKKSNSSDSEIKKNENDQNCEEVQPAVKEESKYQCNHCPFTTTRKCWLQQHMKSHGESNEKVFSTFNCQYCEYETDKMKMLHEHRYVAHPDELPFSCDLCNFRTASSFRLRRHEKNVHKIITRTEKQKQKIHKQFRCNKCKFKTSEKDILAKHKQKCFLSRCPFKCSSCPFRASTSSCLKKHRQTAHKHLRSQGKKIRFTKKKYSFMIYNETNLQIRKVVDARKDHKAEMYFYHCETCDFKNSYLSNFQKHKVAIHNKFFECDNCLFVVDSLETLFSHKSLAHSKLYRFKCSYCSFCASLKKVVDNHEKNFHEPKICYYCDFVTYTMQGLKQHIRLSHPEKYPLECNKCGYQTLKDEFMITHYEKKHLLFNCPCCRSACESSSELFVHMSTLHPEELPHHCDKCSFRTNDSTQLSLHKDRLHITKCYYCDLLVDSHEKLNNHIFEIHPSKIPLHCVICTFHTDHHENLIIHELNVHNMRIFRCRACFYFIDSLNKLSEHISKCHRNCLKINKVNSVCSKQQTFLVKSRNICQLCGFTAKSDIKFYKHLGTAHPDVYRWKCSICNYRAKRTDMVHLHEQKKHNKIFEHKCKFCNFKADKKAKIDAHVYSSHSNKLPYQCDSCSYRSFLKSYVRKHMARKHQRIINNNYFSQTLLQCSECDFQGQNKQNIKTHIYNSHKKLINDCKIRKLTNEESISPNVDSKISCTESRKKLKTESSEMKENDIVISEEQCTSKEAINSECKDPNQLEKKSTSSVINNLPECCSFKIERDQTNKGQLQLPCSLCEFNASNKCDLLSHAKAIHNCSDVHTSDWCSFTTYDLSSLVEHVNDKHPKESKCPYCPFKSVNRSSLESHRTLKHPSEIHSILKLISDI